MPSMKPICLALVLVCALFSTAAAQDITTVPKATLTITANVTGDRVRVTAPSSVVQLHLEVYDVGGEKLFDQEIRGGNVFDWHLQDGQAQRLVPGAYVCVVTAKSISGRLTQKLGTVTVAEKSASVPAGSLQLSPQQAQAIGPVETDSSWTIAGENEPQTPTMIANDGTDGQMIRGRGALTFRVGNFFSGVDTEQMRLTEEGNLGIGTASPQAKLDVAGVIRAERFLIAKPGTSGSGKATSASAATDASNSLQPLTGGSGITGKLTKWIDGPNGTLGDSVITESPAGNIGVGTTNPQGNLHIFGSSGSVNLIVGNAINSESRLRLSYDNVADKSVINSYRGASGYKPLEIDASNVLLNSNSGGNVGIGTANPTAPLTVQAPADAIAVKLIGRGDHVAALDFYKSDGTTLEGRLLAQTGKLTISDSAGAQVLTVSSGNVGIGTTSPAAKLDVAGDVNTLTQYDLGGSRILSDAGDNNVFLGFSAGAANTSGSLNSFFGQTAGEKNTIGASNSFFGKSAGFNNTEGSLNSYFGEGAGGLGSKGSENSFFGEGAGFNATGSSNSFFGRSTGQSNTSGNKVTLIGYHADVTTAFPLTNATAIGADAIVSLSNSVVLGNNANVGIGTTAPEKHLHIMGASDQEIALESSDSGGQQWTLQSSRGTSAGRFEIIDRTANANRFTILSTGEVGIGTTAPGARLQVRSGDIYVETVSKGIILRTPDGTKCYRVTVDNAGGLTTSQVNPCP